MLWADVCSDMLARGVMRAKIRGADWRRATEIPAGGKELGEGAAAAVWSQLDLGH